MSIAFDKHDLLKYDAKHSVLICQKCKYAIQKSALESHLLRHKIYRGERRRLLSSIARLEIFEPDEVQLPPVGSSPVDTLPIISGYRCTATNCENLCASSKRMKLHWSEKHGLSDPPETSARSVNLQTFFRGTKLRYFEVASPRTTARRPSVAIDERLAEHDAIDLAIISTPHEQMTVPLPSPVTA